MLRRAFTAGCGLPRPIFRCLSSANLATGASPSSQLKSLLSSGSEKSVFEHVARHVSSRLPPPLVEQYLFHLLAHNNLNAATSLVHILYQDNASHYALSNQFWSLLASSAAAAGHHAAASLVYHEVISPAAQQEPLAHVPFLLLPTALEHLAVVFVHAGNSAAVDGVRAYFKRFYSNLGHRSAYETLCIAAVEALAKAGDMEYALDRFVDLAFKYRGNGHYRDPKDALHSLKYASHRNFKRRQSNISYNRPSNDTRACSRDGSFIFDPKVVYNNYTIPRGPYWAILDGTFRVADLPYFRALLRAQIRKLVAEKHSVVDRLLAFVSCHHHTLHRFVVACLCDLGCVEEAWVVLSKTPDLYPQMNRMVLFAGMEDFDCLFRALRVRFDLARNLLVTASTSLLSHAADVLSQSYLLALSITSNRPLPVSCRLSYLSALLASPFVNKRDVETALASWRAEKSPKTTVDRQTFARLQLLGISANNVVPIPSMDL